MNFIENNKRRTLWGAMCAALVVALAPGRAWADDPTVSYSLNVSENLQLLLNPNDPIAQANATRGKTGFQLAVERMTPYLILTNQSTVQNGGTGLADLTDFTMTIGDASNNFDWVKIITSSGTTSPGVTVGTVTGGSGSDSITFSNISGLTPGNSIVFQVKLKPDDPSANQFVDYRNVFFQFTPPADPTDTSMNSQSSATFFDTSLGAGVTLPLADWANQDYPNGEDPLIGIHFPSTLNDENVYQYGTGNSGTIPVPEPAGLLLAGLAALGLAFCRRAAC